MTIDLTARTVDFKAGERNVFFHLLTACNLSCQHCYINPSQHGTETLPFEIVLKWLRLFARPEQQSNLILLGGEPTLHPDLAQIIRAAKSLRYTVTVDSNGYLFYDFLEQVQPDELDYLSFSLDGPDTAVNDPLRGDGVFAACTENIRRAVRRGFRTSLIYTVSARNIDQLHRMPALLNDLGVRRFFIQVIGLRGKPAHANKNEEQWQVAPEHWLEVVPRVAEQAAQAGIHVTYPKVFLEDNESFSCAGRVAENYFIFPNGRVYQCPLCEDYPLHHLCIKENQLVQREGVLENRLFTLDIAEGCVMNKLLQPDTLEYSIDGRPKYRISCCMLKQEVLPQAQKIDSP